MTAPARQVGHYRLGEVIGVGSFATVHRARDERLQDEVVRLGGLAELGVERETLQAIAKRLDEPQLEELRMAFQRQADKTWGLEPQLKGLEERDFGQRDGAFLI